MVVLACGCSDQPTEYEPVKTLAQATVWTTECTTAGGTVLSKNVKAAPYNAQGNGSTDDTAAIQSAINAAKSTANGINGTCAVQVYFPAGTYVTSSGLYVPSRVSLKGYSPANSRILRLPGQAAGSIIELTAPQKAGTQAQCGGEQNIRIVGLTLEMRSSLSDTSKPPSAKASTCAAPIIGPKAKCS